jgi:hypothetical protein
MFHLDVAKGSDVAYVAMATHVCFKCMFHMFYLFKTYVPNVSAISEACFILLKHTCIVSVTFETYICKYVAMTIQVC